MSNKNTTQKPIEKPWAVYYQSCPLIVKIVQDTREGIDILNSETVEYFPLVFLSHKNLIRFNQPNEAIEYFCKFYGFSREKVIQGFLENFPSKKNNLQKLLAQISLNPLDKPPFKKDDGFIPP